MSRSTEESQTQNVNRTDRKWWQKTTRRRVNFKFTVCLIPHKSRQTNSWTKQPLYTIDAAWRTNVKFIYMQQVLVNFAFLANSYSSVHLDERRNMVTNNGVVPPPAFGFRHYCHFSCVHLPCHFIYFVFSLRKGVVGKFPTAQTINRNCFLLCDIFRFNVFNNNLIS